MKFNCETYPALVVWDPAANKAAAEFKDGLLETEDENVIALVKKISEEMGITQGKAGQRKQAEAVVAVEDAGDPETAESIDEQSKDAEPGEGIGDKAPKAKAPKGEASKFGEEPSMPELKAKAKELGIASFGVSKATLMEAISKKEAASDEHGDS